MLVSGGVRRPGLEPEVQRGGERGAGRMREHVHTHGGLRAERHVHAGTGKVH